MKGWAAVSDFDGTIILHGVGGQLLLHYGFSDGKTIEDLRFSIFDFFLCIP